MKRKTSRLFSVLLALCLMLTLLPVTVLAADLTQLGTPTNLEWGTRYSNGETQTIPGAISWKTADPDQNMAIVRIYREGETDPVFESERKNFGASDHPEYRSVDDFIRFAGDRFTDGNYYFTVQSIGDAEEYSDSDVSAKSGTFNYTKPGVSLPQLKVSDWTVNEDGVHIANWTALGDETNLFCYEVNWGYAKSADTPEEKYTPLSGSWGITGTSCPIPDYLIEAVGTGYYYYRVRALSKDITKYQNGPWSDWSPAYDSISDQVKDALGQIEVSGEDAKEKLEGVQDKLEEIGSAKLRTAMLADTNSTGGVIDQLKNLEENLGGATGVKGSDELQGYDPTGASVVGATLNKENAEDKITLVVDVPEKEDHVVPERYNSTLAVSFSMDLKYESGESYYEKGEKLKFPIQVTLPIPSSIDPDFLVILHYDQNGVPEAIIPYTFSKGGKNYASFVLDHFSDFAMVPIREEEEEEEVKRPSSDGSSADSGPTTSGVTVSNSGAANGTVTTNVSSARKGENVVVTTKADSGYISAAPIVKDKNGNTVPVTKNANGTYSFIMPEGGVTITGSFVTPGELFSDLSDSAWYREVIAYAVENGLMQGTGGGNFDPGGTTTRGMVMTILARQLGVDTTASGGEPWYQKGMDWAKQAGVSDGTNPGGAITREQLAAMLYRFAGSPTVSGDLSAYPDAGDIHTDWAGDAMIWATQTGIIEGSDGKLNPQSNASRAEAAAMIARFCKNIEK